MVSSGNPKPQSTIRIWSLYSYKYILRVTSSSPPRDKNLTVSSCISSVFCVCAFVMKKPFWRPLRIQARKDVEKACSEWQRHSSALRKRSGFVASSWHDAIITLQRDELLLLCKETQVACALHGSRATLDPQFGEDMAHMQLDRRWCQHRCRCNLLVGSPS